MKKILIALDFDGVINNHYLLRNKSAKDLFGVDLDFRKNRPRDFINNLKLITYNQFKELSKKASLDYQYIEIPAASFYIKKIAKNKRFDIKIVSNRNDKERIDKMKSFLKDLGLLNIVELDLNEGSVKNKALRLEGVNIFVDDIPEQVESAVAEVPHVFLFEQEYSRRVKVKGVKHTSSWKELYEEILFL